MLGLSERSGIGRSDSERQPAYAGDRDPVADLRPGVALRVPDLAAEPNPSARVAGLDHLGGRSDQGLLAGDDPVAAEEPDPEADLGDLDHRRRGHDGEPPSWRQHQECEGDGADQKHWAMLRPVGSEAPTGMGAEVSGSDRAESS